MDTFQSYGRQPFIRHISVQRYMHNAHINTYQNNITSTLAMHGLLNPTFAAAIATVELCLDLLHLSVSSLTFTFILFTLQPVSTRQNIFWKLKFRDDKWAVYYEKPEAGILYALPVKSDDPNQSPPSGNLIKAVRTDQRQQDVFVFNFSWVDSIKYSDALPPGVDILIRPRAHS